ncbi:MAG: DUF559 domain-containing protein [Beijerinckiaceae bacterium]|nr:DUF559 domain-containing protein [Beijerinckiaceae bacterium]
MANAVARRLRKTMTPHEVRLWVQLRALKAQGFHIRRQAPLDRYIVDFLCLKAKLVIEVDGSQHGFERGLRHDAARDTRLADLGFLTLRFWNEDIRTNLAGVVETILHHCLTRQELFAQRPTRPCGPPSPEWEG